MTLELNETQIEYLKDALMASLRITREDRAKWLKEEDDFIREQLVDSCDSHIAALEEIENMIY